MNPDTSQSTSGADAVPGAVPDPPREVELKLLLEPADLHLLRRHRRVRELAVSRAVTRRLVTAYFDTPDLDLLKQGLTLRVRRVGRRYLQTLKVPPEGSAGGLLNRMEIEAPVPGGVPDASRIADPELRARVAPLAETAGFGPILETEFQRTERRLCVGDTSFLFDLDVGEVRTVRSVAPICELELELESGDPVHLFDLATELQRTVRLRLSTRSKHERGVELLTGEQPTPRRAKRLRLPEDATVERALEDALRGGFDQILANEEPARRGVDPEGVHQMRVGVRRVRSAMTLFRQVLPMEQVRDLREDLRWLTEQLGQARDLDVFVDENLGALRRRFPDDPDLKRLHDEAAQMRAEAYVGVRACLGSLRYAELMLRLGRWIVGREWRRQPTSPTSARLFLPARDVAGELLHRRYRRVRRRGRALEHTGEREKHALRIEAKKLRYAAEFLRSLYPGRGAGRFIRAVTRVQDTLGHLNDAATARALLARVLDRLDSEARPDLVRAAGFVEGWISRAAEEQLTGLEDRWARLNERSPFW